MPAFMIYSTRLLLQQDGNKLFVFLIKAMDIEIRDLKFSHYGTSDGILLDIANWSVERGEKIFVYGPSGCGTRGLSVGQVRWVDPLCGSLLVRRC